MTRRSLLPPSRLRPKSTELCTAVDSGALELAQPARSRMVEEVLGLPIRLLQEMPLASSLLCSFAHEGGRVVLATASLPASALGDPPAPAFVGPEVHALALAAEHERAGAATMRAWCAKKPDWRLTSIEAIGKLGHKVEPLGWSTERVLWALGLRLDEVWL